MTDNTAPATADAVVATERPERYGKQLVSHLGRRNGGEWSADTGSGWINLGTGRAAVTAGDSALLLHIDGTNDEIARLEEVVGGHLVRFGERDELTVTWHRSATS